MFWSPWLENCPYGVKNIFIRTRSIENISCAANLAHQGLLRCVEDVKLEDVDLASVPTEHLLSSLTSCADDTHWTIAARGNSPYSVDRFQTD